MEKLIYPKYQDIAFNLSDQKAVLNENAHTLTTAVVKHGEEWRTKNHSYSKLWSWWNEFQTTGCLKKQKDEITQSIANLNELLESNDISLLSAYKFRSEEYTDTVIRLGGWGPFGVYSISSGDIWT